MSWMQKRGVARSIGAVVLATGALVGVVATQAQAATTTYKGPERSTEAQAWSDSEGLAHRCQGASRISKFVIDSVAKGYRTYQGGVDCIS